jgi:hypothetical protein
VAAAHVSPAGFAQGVAAPTDALDNLPAGRPVAVVNTAQPSRQPTATPIPDPGGKVITPQPGDGQGNPTVEPHGVDDASPAVSQPSVAREDAETPSPRGAGLIAEVLTADGEAIEASVARLLDRFKELGVQVEGPVRSVPSPLAIAAGLIALEAGRRWLSRRRQATAPRLSRGNSLVLHGFF